MKKQDLVEKLAKELDTTKASVEKFIKSTFEVISDVMKKGDSITIPGFGTFSSSKRKKTTARNPRTGEVVEVPARKVPKFKPSSKLKEHVDGKKKK